MGFVCLRRAFLAFLLLGDYVIGFGADYGKVTTQKVVDGVYQFSVSDYGDVGMSGNSIAIIGNDGVLLFDTTGTPASARIVLAELRKITKRPVRYVVNSHWHWDHWGGNQVFKAAYPNVQIIAHEKTRDLMMRDAVEWNRDYLATMIPEHIDEIAAAARKAKSSAERAHLTELAKVDRDFLHQKRTLKNTFPDEVFADSMTLFLGDREVQLLHARAITPGDAFVYLPKEKILLTGDTLVYPIPFAIGGVYPASWIDALQRLKGLDPAIIVPGHGAAERNQEFLDSNLKLFQKVAADVKQAKNEGLSLEQTMQRFSNNSAQYASMLGLDSKSTASFRGLFLNGFVKNSYLELEHPLSDTPMR